MDSDPSAWSEPLVATCSTLVTTVCPLDGRWPVRCPSGRGRARARLCCRHYARGLGGAGGTRQVTFGDEGARWSSRRSQDVLEGRSALVLGRRTHVVLHHPAQPVTRGRTLAVAGLVDDARRVLAAVDPIAPRPSVTKVSGDGTDERIELRLRVEGLDHDVTTLATLRVVAVVAHDEASDAVIGHIDDPHHRRLGRWRHLRLRQ